MAITLIGQCVNSPKGSEDDVLREEYETEYYVRVTGDDVTRVTPVQILQCPGLPDLWERYAPQLPNQFGYAACVQKKSARKSQDSPFLWIVTVNWSTEVADEVRQNLNPLLRPPIVSWDPHQGTYPLEYDSSGRPIVNSARLPFDPPFLREEATMMLTIEKNFETYDMNAALLYTDAVNSDTWYGKPPGFWKCRGIRGRDAFERDTYFWTRTYQFEYRRRGWVGPPDPKTRQVLPGSALKTRLLDRGKAEMINGRPKVIRDALGGAIPEPVCLDGSGLRIDRGPDRVATLTLAATAGATTLTVFDNRDLVAGKIAYIENEQVLVTAVPQTATGIPSSVTVQRGKNGTTAASHAAGKKIYQTSGAITKVATPLFIINQVEVEDATVFGLPAGRLFIRIDDEELFVTNIAGNLLSVIRGMNGTAQANHAAGTQVKQSPSFLDFDCVVALPFADLGLGGA